MDEDDELIRALMRLYSTMNEIQMAGKRADHYWHFDEDFAAFMDHVLEPVDVN